LRRWTISHHSSVTFYHATPTRNLPSILEVGLDPAYARGRLRVVWLHSRGRRAWAIPHVAERHNVPVEAVSIITVRVPRSWLVRRKRGVWTCRDLIRPRFLVAVNPFAHVA
jgi:hypothetical protein